MVPEAHTDYIISVISEEFGVVAIILLLILFLFFIYTVFKKIYLEKNEKIKLVLTGSICIIIFQALIHVGVNIRLFPTTGMTLPFLRIKRASEDFSNKRLSNLSNLSTCSIS